MQVKSYTATLTKSWESAFETLDSLIRVDLGPDIIIHNIKMLFIDKRILHVKEML